MAHIAEEPVAIAAKAESAAASGDWAAAADAYEALVRSEPKQIDWKYQLAQAYEELGRFDDAIAVLTDPSIADRDKSKRRLAKTYIEAKHFDSAMPLVEELMALFPGNSKYEGWKSLCDISRRIQQGEALVAANSLDEAESLYLDLLAQYPETARAYLHLGQIYAEQKRWGDAIPPLRAGLKVEPDSLKLRTALARALFKNGEPAEAISLLQADGCRDDVDSLFLLQRCHTELHDWRQVDQVASRLLAILPPNDTLRDVVAKARQDAIVQEASASADAMASSGDLDGAISGYRDLVARHADSALAWLKLGTALAEAERDEEALVALREGRDRHPEDVDIRAALTRAVFKSSDDEQILRHVQQAVAAGRADFESLRWLARYQADRKDWPGSLESATAALAIDAVSSSARVLLVRALIELNRLPEALEEVQTLLATGEKQVEALQLKGDILLELSRVDEAIRLYCQALRLSRRDPLVAERLDAALQLKSAAEPFPLQALDGLPIAVDDARIEAAMRPFLGSEVDDRSWNKRHRKMWRAAVDRVAGGRATERDRKLVEEEYAVWATMGFDRYRTDRQDLASIPWSWRDRRVALDGAGAARMRSVLFSAVLDRLQPQRVLEVGSGNGMNLLALAGAFPQVEFAGVELTNEGVEEARRAQSDPAIAQIIHDYTPLEVADAPAIERIGFVQGDAAALPFEDGSFDLVMTVLAAEQMESIRAVALSELARVSSRYVLMLEPFRDLNQKGLRGLYVQSRGYFRGSIAELRDFGLDPQWATADFPQETFLGTALVLAEKTAA